jgi:hypothetical protein
MPKKMTTKPTPTPKKSLTQHEMAVMGGEARARKFTKKQRSESARHAALARWADREDQATA